MKQRNCLLDIFKLLLSFFVVFIHTGLLSYVSYGIFIKDIVFRLAVPFFFVCSGYYFSKNESKSKKYFKKLIIPYVILSPIYTLVSKFLFNYNFSFIKSEFVRFIFGCPQNIMWYSGTLFLTLVILKKIKLKKVLISSILISLILYVIGLSFTTYNWILILHYPKLSSFFSKIFLSNRNILFVGFLFTSIGYYMGKYLKNTKNTQKQIVALIISFIFLVLEVCIVKSHIDLVIEHDFYFSHIVLIPTLFLIISNISIDFKYDTRIFRDLSSFVYYFHFLIIYLFIFLNDYKNIKSDFFQGVHYLKFSFAVLLFTLAIGILLLGVRKRRLKCKQ